VAALKTAVSGVEAAVASEAAKRQDTAAALQGWAERQVLGVKTRLEDMITANHADIIARFGAIHARVDELAAKFDVDRAATIAEVERRNAELLASLASFQAAFEAERADRVKREAAIAERMAGEEHRAVARWDGERSVREAAYMDVRGKLEAAVAARATADARFQAGVLEEVAALRNSIAAEARARAAEDEALAGVLDKYVQKLQASLALINTMDDEVGPGPGVGGAAGGGGR
jgi:hypothetical protein